MKSTKALQSRMGGTSLAAPARILATVLATMALGSIALTGCNWYSLFPGTNSCDGWNCGWNCTKLIPGTTYEGCYVSMNDCCLCRWTVGPCRWNFGGINCGAGWVSTYKLKIKGMCSTSTPLDCVAAEDPPGGG